MKIHGICLVKDEVDVIEETLRDAQRWCDYIYIYDNGSTDGTWEKVQLISKDSNGQVIIFKQSDRPFHDRLRGEVFENYKKNSNLGDWWNRLDADEMYIDNPRQFLVEIPDEYDCVYSSSFQYYFTNKDCELYEQNPEAFSDDVSVRKKCRYYLNNCSELRFVRHKESTLWDRHVAWPYRLTRAYPHRIRLQHYQYRSPEQIQRRINSRTRTVAMGFAHERMSNWQEVITASVKERKYFPQLVPNKNLDWRDRTVDSSFLNYDRQDGHLVPREDLLAPLPPPCPFEYQMIPTYCFKLKFHITAFLKRQIK
jgi:glycosyltransferase involved in cell wall biosynthesis